MNILIRKSQIIELVSDEKPYSHNANEVDIKEHSRISGQQYMYNKLKVKDETIPNALKLKKKKSSKGEMEFGNDKVNKTVDMELEYQPEILSSARGLIRKSPEKY